MPGNQQLTTKPNRPAHAVATAIAALALAGPAALAGPCWEEPPISDAGSTPATAQIPTGSGPLTRIEGRLGVQGANLGLIDPEDLYLIFIENPAAFSASTSPEFGANAEFPTALWLFPANANAALANRDFALGIPGSTLLPEANDDTGFAITKPGLYYLAITGNNAMPVAGPDLLPMFSFNFPFEISGPDGPGATQPLSTWDSTAANGHYAIALQGITFAAPPCPGDLNLDGIVDADDLGILLNNFGCGAAPCTGDINLDGIVNADDLGILLNNFGTICGPTGACCLPNGSCLTTTIYHCQQESGLFQGQATSCDTTDCPTLITSSCCTPQPTPGCDDPTCELIVCSGEPFCCTVEWDQICANRALNAPDCPCN